MTLDDLPSIPYKTLDTHRTTREIDPEGADPEKGKELKELMQEKYG